MECRLKIRIGEDGNYFFGPGVAALLKNIDFCRSVRQAAAQMELSYSKAWHMIKNSEDGFGRRLVERNVGGIGGGSASLTEDGRAVMERYYALEEKLEEAGNSLFLEIYGDYI